MHKLTHYHTHQAAGKIAMVVAMVALLASVAYFYQKMDGSRSSSNSGAGAGKEDLGAGLALQSQINDVSAVLCVSSIGISLWIHNADGKRCWRVNARLVVRSEHKSCDVPVMSKACRLLILRWTHAFPHALLNTPCTIHRCVYGSLKRCSRNWRRRTLR